MLNFVFALILQPELHQTADILVQRGILAQKARFRSKVDTEAVTDPHGNSCQHRPLQHVLHGMQDAARCGGLHTRSKGAFGPQPDQCGGEQQRGAIARALANAPKLLLADEPTGNLDPKTSDVVFAELLNIVKETGLSALIATHNMELASAMDRKVRLEDGRLVNTGISGLISGENFY